MMNYLISGIYFTLLFVDLAFFGTPEYDQESVANLLNMLGLYPLFYVFGREICEVNLKYHVTFATL
jgi:hypothetical protein